MIQITPVTAATNTLTATGGLGYVRVDNRNGLVLGSQVTLTHGGVVSAALKIMGMIGVPGGDDVTVSLVVASTGAAFNAAGYVAGDVLTVPAQSVWSDGAHTWTDIEMQSILGAVLPGGSGAPTVIDVSNWPTTLPSSAAVTEVSASATAVTILAADTSRRRFAVYNDSTSDMYLKMGAGASSSSYSILVTAGSFYEDATGYQGQVTGAWDTATGTARTTEYLA